LCSALDRVVVAPGGQVGVPATRKATDPRHPQLAPAHLPAGTVHQRVDCRPVHPRRPAGSAHHGLARSSRNLGL